MNSTFKSKFLKPNNRYPEGYVHQPLYHPDNKDLALYYDTHYDLFHLLLQKGPLVYPYMKRMINTVSDYYSSHSKVFAVRCELYFPYDWDLDHRLNRKTVTKDGLSIEAKQAYFSKDYFSRFLAAFKAQMEALHKQDAKKGQTKGLDFAFVRTYEIGQKTRNRGFHIHLLLLLNGQRFQSLGLYDSKQKQQSLTANSISTRIKKAWASAIFGTEPNSNDNALEPWQANIPNYRALEKVHDQALVHFGRTWRPQSNKDQERDQMIDVVLASSYLVKADTKAFGFKVQTFDCSSRTAITDKPYRADPNQYHRGNPNLPLYRKPCFERYPLDVSAAPYIETDLHSLLSFQKQCMSRWSGIFAVRLSLVVPEDVLKMRNTSVYMVKVIESLQAALIPNSNKSIRMQTMAFAIYGALALKRNETGQLVYHAMLCMKPVVYERYFDDTQYGSTWLLDWLCEEVAKVHGISQPEVRERLDVGSIHSFRENGDNAQQERENLFKQLAYLATAADAFSITSTLALVNPEVKKLRKW